MTRSITRACAALGLLLGVSAVASTPTEPEKPLPVYLKDGSKLEVVAYPWSGFGIVRLTLTDGRTVQMNFAKVDWDRTEAAWYGPKSWAALDHATAQGRAFPAFEATDADQERVAVTGASSGLTYIEVWSGY